MKKKIAFIIMTSIVGGLLYFTGNSNTNAYSYGPPAGYTGSPADGKTCNASGCHDAYALQGVMPWISSNVPISGYWPDSVYTITAKAIKGGGFNNFGFQISPQSIIGAALGTLINTSSTTQIVGAKYIEQTVNGYATTTADSMVWVFQWKAPSVGIDSVIFYGAFNCGASDKKATGRIYKANLVVHQNKTAGINTLQNESTSLSVFPNPARQIVNISYKLTCTANVDIFMFGTDGRRICNFSNATTEAGNHIQSLTLPYGTKPGVYFIQLVTNGQSAIQKVIFE